MAAWSGWKVPFEFVNTYIKTGQFLDWKPMDACKRRKIFHISKAQ